jgi:hypothetical protein
MDYLNIYIFCKKLVETHNKGLYTWEQGYCTVCVSKQEFIPKNYEFRYRFLFFFIIMQFI